MRHTTYNLDSPREWLAAEERIRAAMRDTLAVEIDCIVSHDEAVDTLAAYAGLSFEEYAYDSDTNGDAWHGFGQLTIATQQPNNEGRYTVARCAADGITPRAPLASFAELEDAQQCARAWRATHRWRYGAVVFDTLDGVSIDQHGTRRTITEHAE